MNTEEVKENTDLEEGTVAEAEEAPAVTSDRPLEEQEAEFWKKVDEAQPEEGDGNSSPVVDIDPSAVEDLILETEANLKELNHQIQKAKLAELFFSARIKLGKPGATGRMQALASAQQRIHELAGNYNEQADFVDFLKEKREDLKKA